MPHETGPRPRSRTNPQSPKTKKPPAKTPPAKTPVRLLTSAQVAAAVKTLAGPTGTARFGAGKALLVTAEQEPARVYPHFAAVAALLTSDSKIIRWSAMLILAALAPVDRAQKLPAILDTYLSFIQGHNMISAGNAIRGAGQIALARPELLDRIIPAILAVEGATYETPECRNVAIGHALDALRSVWPSVRQRPEVAAFVCGQRTNTRAAVARRAERLAAELP